MCVFLVYVFGVRIVLLFASKKRCFFFLCVCLFFLVLFLEANMVCFCLVIFSCVFQHVEYCLPLCSAAVV